MRFRPAGRTFSQRWGALVRRRWRRGVSALDYVLILGTVLPCVAFIFGVGPKIMRLAYEMVAVLVSWPFM